MREALPVRCGPAPRQCARRRFLTCSDKPDYNELHGRGRREPVEGVA